MPSNPAELNFEAPFPQRPKAFRTPFRTSCGAAVGALVGPGRPACWASFLHLSCVVSRLTVPRSGVRPGRGPGAAWCRVRRLRPVLAERDRHA